MKKVLLLLFIAITYTGYAQDCTVATTTPYLEDFSAGTPECWAYENADSTNPVWSYNNSVDITGNGTPDPLMVMIPQNVSQRLKDDWAFSRKINLTAGTAYDVIAVYNAFNLGNNTADENFELVITDEPSSTAAFSEVIGTYNNILQQGEFPGQNDGTDIKSQAYTATETFTPTTSGEYYVAIHALGTTGANGGGFFLFNTTIEEAEETCPAVALPYIEDFADGAPECWEFENADGTNPVWAYNNGVDITGNGTPDPLMVMIPQNVSQRLKDDWTFTQKISLAAGTAYNVSAVYNAFNLGNVTAVENFELVITDAQSSTATFSEVIGTYNNILQQGEFPGQNDGADIKSQAYTATETFTPTTTGDYYIAIHALGTTEANGGGFFLFSTAIEEAEAGCAEVSIPYLEDFVAGEPSCVLTEDTDNTDPVFVFNSTLDVTGDGNSDNFYQIISPGVPFPDKDDWLFGQKVQLEAGTTYYFSTHYNVVNLGNSSSFEDFELYVLDAQSSTAPFKQLLNTYTGILEQGEFPGNNDGNDIKTRAYYAEESFTPTASGEYYLGIHSTGSAVSGGAFLVFDLGVSDVSSGPDCTAPVTLPYLEDMADGTPDCWIYENTDNQNPVWAYNNNLDITGNGTNDPFLVVLPSNNSQSQKDDWAFSPKIQFVANSNYSIEAIYNSLNLGNGTASENFELVILNAPDSNASFQEVIGSYTDIGQQGVFPGANDGNDLKSQAYSASETFVPSTSGEYYVGVHATGSNVAAGFILFELSINFVVTPTGGEFIILPTTGLATSVNGNGTWVTGYDSEHFVWNETNGFQNIGGIVPGPGIGGKPGISDDGSKIGASYLNPVTDVIEMSMYDVATFTWTPLGGLGGEDGNNETSSAHDISGDASTIVGLAYVANSNLPHAARWTLPEGVVDLGPFGTTNYSRANKVNFDGSVVVGWQDTNSGFRQGSVWVNDVQQGISLANGDAIGSAEGVSSDGIWVVGEGSASNNYLAYRWSAATGVQNLGPALQSGFRGIAFGISGDGSSVVGVYRSNGLPAIFGEGFFWTEDTGVVNLNDYAASLGIDTQGITLSLPLDISTDGSTIVGAGLDASNQRVGFVLKLRPTLGVTENTVKKNYSYYPNPVKGMLHIKSKDIFENVSVYNVSGQEIMNKNVSGNSIDLDLSTLSSGIYLVKVIGNKAVETIRIVKN